MKEKKKLLIAAGLVFVIAIGGVFAYFNQTLSVENPFDTGKYDTELTEDFNPGDGENWEPGSTVNKDVAVNNTGDYDVLVRVKFDEKWVDKKNTNNVIKSLTGLNDETFQADAADGKIDADKSVVVKNLNKDNWVYADGYWYYKANLKAGTSTGKFLDSVQLLEDADMGKYFVTKYYTKAADKPDSTNIGENPDSQWVVYTGAVPEGAKHNMTKTTLDSKASGYGNADYTLTITAQTVQATEAAMKEAFGLTGIPAGCNWTLSK